VAVGDRVKRTRVNNSIHRRRLLEIAAAHSNGWLQYGQMPSADRRGIVLN